MGLHVLVALVAARGIAQLFHVSALLLRPLNLWLPLARHLCGSLAAHLSWLRRAYARGGTVWSRRSRDDDDVLRQTLLELSF